MFWRWELLNAVVAEDVVPTARIRLEPCARNPDYDLLDKATFEVLQRFYVPGVLMNVARLFSLLLWSSFLTACGSSSKSRVIDGAWNASLLNSDSSVAYTFQTTLNQDTGTAVKVIRFDFTSNARCFTAPIGQSATFSATGHSRGFQTGPFGMTITSAQGTMVEDVLTLRGTRNADGNISGTWTLTGLGGCSGNGNYTMTAIPAL